MSNFGGALNFSSAPLWGKDIASGKEDQIGPDERGRTAILRPQIWAVFGVFALGIVSSKCDT
jgi:hypothetical protein